MEGSPSRRRFYFGLVQASRADLATIIRYHARLDHGPPRYFFLQYPPQLPPRAQDLSRRSRRSSRHLHHLLAVLLAAVW
jgi:hypothetical protein